MMTLVPLLLAACGGQSDWRGLVKIGLVAPFSGYDSQTAYRLLSAFRAEIGEVNRDGGIAGYGVEIVALDDSNDPLLAARRAGELAVDPNVIIAVARLGGRGESAVQEYRRLGLPLLAIGSPLASSEASDAVWRLCASAAEEGRQAALFATRFDVAGRFAVVDAAGAGYQAAATAFQETVAGRTFRLSVATDSDGRGAGAGEAARLAEEIARADARFVYFSGPYDIGVRLATALEPLSAARVLLGSDADTPALARLRPPESIAGHVASCVPPATSRAQQSGTTIASAGSPVNAQESLELETARLALDAIRLASSRGRPDRQSATLALRNGATQGTHGRIDFEADGTRQNASATVRGSGP